MRLQGVQCGLLHQGQLLLKMHEQISQLLNLHTHWLQYMCSNIFRKYGRDVQSL